MSSFQASVPASYLLSYLIRMVLWQMYASAILRLQAISETALVQERCLAVLQIVSL